MSPKIENYNFIAMVGELLFTNDSKFSESESRIVFTILFFIVFSLQILSLLSKCSSSLQVPCKLT